MTLTALPSLVRTSPTFVTEVDDFFSVGLPRLVTEVNLLETDLSAKQVTASAAAATATAKEILTDADATATAADRVQTGLDRTAAAGSASAASTSASTASTGASTATTKASEANASAVAAAASAASIAAGPVASVNGMTGTVTGVATLTSVQTLTNKTLTSPVINAPTGIVKGDVGLGNVDNTSNATERAATATLTNKTLTSPVINAPTGIVKGDVGLGNVDNTSNATERAATATLTNKTLTSPVINTPTGIVKSDVGLGNVDNTSNATERAATATLTNKTLTSPVINTPTGIVKGDVGLGNVDNTSNATERAATVTLTNKTLALGSNTVSGTTAQFNTALTDGDFATLAGTETLTNKTLTTPVINAPTGIVKGDVGLGNVDNTSNATERAATATLTNKTLTSPVINTPTGIVKGDVGLGNVDNTSNATERSAAATLTNKTLALGSNTVSGTTAQFNTALTDGDFATLAGTETLTNKTLTSPAINGGVIDTTSTTATAALGTSSTRLANTAFVQQEKEYLPALSQSLHIGAVVKAIVYDTSKDSDGGAWRKRCADKSWYTETLGGDRWIGQHATISAAWTAAGSTTGAVFLASATAGPIVSGYYYAATSSTTATQVYRGVTREFPAVAGIVAESARVVIYDLTQVGTPMWMVFAGASSKMVGNNNVSSLAALNGTLCIGDGTYDVYCPSFAADTSYRRAVTGVTGPWNGLISDRNTTKAYATSGTNHIVTRAVNDVAITVLDTAPIDPATGLPVPTIAVATAGGVSVIKDDGTVVTGGTLTDYKRVHITKLGDLVADQGNGSSAVRVSRSIGSLGASFTQTALYSSGSVPSLFSTYPVALNSGAGVLTIGETVGLALVKENPATPTKGMVAYVTTAYNSGWLPGDIRGAYLADTTAETVTASGELVTNGTFSSDTNWTDYLNGSTGGSVVITGSAMVITQGSDSVAMGGGQGITTVVGKTYTATVTNTTAVNARLRIGGSVVGSSGVIESASFQSSSQSTTFVATATTTYITPISVGAATSVVNITLASVKLAEPDRSVKNKGLVINGSLTKTAVASGAGLVAWSGFSAANYLEQPYNSDLDFGTGDFSVMGWVKVTSGNTVSFIQQTATNSQTGLWSDKRWDLYYYNASGILVFQGTAGGVAGAFVMSPITVGQWYFVCVSYVSGTAYLYVDGVLASSGAFSLATAGTYNKLVIGGIAAGSVNGDYRQMSLLRISATAPSADQIAHIYRTELPLFQASAQCTIAGSSTAVTALAYDDTTEMLHVGTSWGRTGFKDLLRVDSEATTTGALTSLSASQGVIITGGTSGKVYVPAFLLRDELRRKDEARKALGKVPVSLDFTATASQTAFVLAKGYTAKFVYVNGLLQRLTGQYTVSTDGFQETVTMVTGVPINQYVTVIAVRS